MGTAFEQETGGASSAPQAPFALAWEGAQAEYTGESAVGGTAYGDIALSGINMNALETFSVVEPESLKKSADIALAGLDAALKQSQTSADLQASALKMTADMAKLTQGGDLPGIIKTGLILAAIIAGWFFIVKRRG